MLAGLGALLIVLQATPVYAGVVSGTLKNWHPVEIRFTGGSPLCETSDPSVDGNPNPFLNRRLNVTLTHLDALSMPTHSYVVPGFFAGDGKGGSCGNTWMIRFTPDDSGTWIYTASFREGANVSISVDPVDGSPVLFDGDTDSFVVGTTDPTAPGFLATGRLQYFGNHYLRQAEGGFFIKGGTDSPENLFGARAFDDSEDQPGGLDTTGLPDGIHRYSSHVADFGAAGLGDSSDPFWTSNIGGDSRGVIGLLNYLGSVNVNSVYFLPMNLGGDGRETFPFVNPNGTLYGNTHYDLSKLYQWNKALNHAQRKGIMWNCVLGETESANEQWFSPQIDVLSGQRMLFYREIVARFGYLNGIKWNLGEESDLPPAALNKFADYIASIDPYGHPICFHTNTLPADGSYAQYTSVIGDTRYSASSIQYVPTESGQHVEKWRTDSALAGRPWIIDSDEQTAGLSSTNHDSRRKTVLYDVLFSGGNIEWYFGAFSLPEGGDVTAEDMRTRASMWDFMWYARKFLLENVPFQRMQPADQTLTGESPNNGGAEVFAWEGHSYAIYFPSAFKTGSLDLPEGNYTIQWYDPRTGQFIGTATPLFGTSSTSLGAPPYQPGNDWVLLVKRVLDPGQLSFSTLYPGIPDTPNHSWIAGALPGSPLLIYYSVTGTTTVPLQGCPLVSFNLLDEQFGIVLVANVRGEKKLNVNVSSGPLPGTTVYLQAIAPFECSASNVSTFTW